MEDTTCLEYIVSVFEKISFENSFLLLENNVFVSLINVIDFLATPQRKSIMKICQNISVNAITYNQFNQYIKPALEQLCYLTKFNEENSYVNEKAIYIYYNISVTVCQAFKHKPLKFKHYSSDERIESSNSSIKGTPLLIEQKSKRMPV